MGQIYVKASRRAKAHTRRSVLKAYITGPASIFHQGQMQANLGTLKQKYDNGFRLLKRQGYNFRIFHRNLARKAHKYRNG